MAGAYAHVPLTLGTDGPLSAPQQEPEGTGGPEPNPWKARVRRPVLVATALLALAALVPLRSALRTSVGPPPDRSDLRDAAGVAQDWVGFAGQTVPFTSVELAAYGYNVFYADPAPPWNPSLPVNRDPGLRKPVFAITYRQNRVSGDRRHLQPDGYHASVDLGCSSAFTFKTISDEFEYTRETEAEIGASVGVEAKMEGGFPRQKDRQTGKVSPSVSASLAAGVTASLSWKSKLVREGRELQQQTMQRSVARCAHYTVALDFGNLPEPDRAFDAAVDSLWGGMLAPLLRRPPHAAVNTAEHFYNLFDDYGTHFLTLVRMGARYSVMSYFRKDDFQEMQTTADGLGMSVVAAVQGTVALKLDKESQPDPAKPKSTKRWESSPGLKDQLKDGGAELTLLDLKAEKEFEVFGPKEVEAAKRFAQFVQKFEESSVGPRIPLAGMSEWLEEVKKAPVPISFDRREICLHPSFTRRGLTQQCQDHLKTYCSGRLWARGAPCKAAQARECDNDLDCSSVPDAVCRAYKCVQVPVCQVTLCREKLPRCGESYTLPNVTALAKPLGQEFELKNGDWADKVKAIQLSHGCKEIEAVDDDGTCSLGKADNGRYTSTQNSLPYDLENDICMIKVWAKEIPQDPSTTWSTVDRGTSYRGKQTRTRSGKTCQDWSAQSPQEHQNEPSRWPNAGLEANFCRNPDNSDTIWCYTTDPSVRWEYCDPEQAPTYSELLIGNGVSYSGRQTSTQSGRQCQEWGRQVPHGHQYTTSNYPYAGLEANYCRNPDGSGDTIWCYTTDPNVRWEYCRPPRPNRRLSANDSEARGFGDEASGMRPGRLRLQAAQPGLSAAFLRAVQEADAHAAEWRAEAPNASEARRLQAGQFIKNVGKAFYGYNNYYGAPLSAENAGTDPGFQHRPVWAADYSRGTTASFETFKAVLKPGARRLDAPTLGEPWPGNWTGHVASPPRKLQDRLLVPDGWRARVAVSTICEKNFTTRSFKNEYEYEQDMTRSSSLSISLGIFSFEMSSEETEFRRSSNKNKKMLTASSAECLDYVLELDESRPPPTNPSFQFVVNTSTSEEEFHVLFDLYGLHFPKSVAFGARYGYTRYIDESNYALATSSSSESNLEAKVSYSLGAMKMGPAQAGVGASAGVAKKDKAESAAARRTLQYFQEAKEFSVGKRLPAGGADAWVKDVSGDPMPIRFDLKPLCEHPALASKRQDCQRYSGTYCEKHLRLLNNKIRCAPPQRPQCLWDLDCSKIEASKCIDGTCVQSPSCTVEIFTGQNFRGASMTLGPVFRATKPEYVQELSKYWMTNIRSVKVSGGCEEVTLMDEDSCMFNHPDNMLIESRRTNLDKTVDTLIYDLDQDVCKIRMVPKARWV